MVKKEKRVLAFVGYILMLVWSNWTVLAQQEIETSVVFRKGEYYGYRIPSVVVSKKGTVLAFCERRVGLHDHAQNDMVLKRSSDGGRTWSPEIIVHEERCLFLPTDMLLRSCQPSNDHPYFTGENIPGGDPAADLHCDPVLGFEFRTDRLRGRDHRFALGQPFQCFRELAVDHEFLELIVEV